MPVVIEWNHWQRRLAPRCTGNQYWINPHNFYDVAQQNRCYLMFAGFMNGLEIHSFAQRHRYRAYLHDPVDKNLVKYLS